MSDRISSFERLDALAALAAGIIPPDEKDAGAANANVWPRLSAKLDTVVYADGLAVAGRIAQEKFRRPVGELSPQEMYKLLDTLREESPAFFKQLRMDVS